MVISVGAMIGRMCRRMIRLHEHPLADFHHLGAGGAEVNRDAGQGQNEDDVGDRRGEDVKHDHRQQK